MERWTTCSVEDVRGKQKKLLELCHKALKYSIVEDSTRLYPENYEKGKSIRKIAVFLGRSPSTISRELKRNWSKKKNHYHAWGANVKYICRRKNCHRKNNLLLNEEMYQFTHKGLLQYWSPEIIAGKWNSTHEEKISFSSIYRAVRANMFPGIKPWTHFRRKAKPYSHQKKSYTRFFDSSIHDRPEIIDNRGRLGDFEGDTVYGSVGKGYLITGVDRQSRQFVAAIAKDKKIESTNAAFISAFANAEIKVKPLTLTLDNGTEFLGFKELEKDLGVKVYFADSHSPWQRGSNENINGLVRFFFPRGTDFNKVTQEQLDAVVSLINNRPRKCLGFLSPNDFLKKVLHLA